MGPTLSAMLLTDAGENSKQPIISNDHNSRICGDQGGSKPNCDDVELFDARSSFFFPLCPFGNESDPAISKNVCQFVNMGWTRGLG